ncbi:phosphorus acquisition-controlling [Pyrenophora seminiperda CCB06]|uniref:Phosphorus acquisition-controlling n=1 Tax=Pyrenophora seminiperda CCB06 TaxID=1302712 RepID=A0A3M7MCU6_9PLEO|nr:phosphorus acquisition-controlling [Pyrenophora seminiperda CCB06]
MRTSAASHARVKPALTLDSAMPSTMTAMDDGSRRLVKPLHLHIYCVGVGPTVHCNPYVHTVEMWDARATSPFLSNRRGGPQGTRPLLVQCLTTRPSDPESQTTHPPAASCRGRRRQRPSIPPPKAQEAASQVPICQAHVKEPHRRTALVPIPRQPHPPITATAKFLSPLRSGFRAQVMNSSTGQPWSTAEQFAMDQTTQDFAGTEFIDFDGLDLHFNIDGYNHDGPASNGNQLADLTESLNVHHLQRQFPPQLPQDRRDGSNGGHQVQNLAPHGMSQPADSFFDYGMSQYSQAGTPTFSQPQDQIYRPHQGVPPTPNSVEMHGDPARYIQQMESYHALFDQRYHMPKDDATFTPLDSPAVTPHDTRFQIPDFTVPGVYFSPLASPALNAQSRQHAHQQSQNTTSGSSTGHSPTDVDMDMDMLGEPAIVSQEQGKRNLRSTTKRNIPRANGNGRVRQSPIVKPNRWKTAVSSLVPPKEVSELVKEARPTRPSSSGLDVPMTRESSETDSISPEPMLSEMRPPPKPGSSTASPAMVAQRNNHHSTPATPASLMRIQPSPGFNSHRQPLPMLEDLTLPEASLDRPGLSRIDTAIRDEDSDTPRMSARKTPKLNPLSTPGGSISGRPSPMIDAMSTPTSPAFSMSNSKRDPKSARNPKKRNSVSTSLVSPALRPKISPIIKPLLPDGGSGGTDNTHALLLASKSNYQNIIDGTTVPGVIYPTSLSTNLTSKRTSHKIAEQGRRNRINMALQEMQALLPSPQLGATPDAKSPESNAQNSNNSKAAKVESAIEYIKQLKQEVSERDNLLSQKDQEMDALRKELAALKRSGSEGSVSEVEAAAQPKAEPSSSPNTENET